MNKHLLKLLLIPLLLTPASIVAQQVGIKTNLMQWAGTTPNIGVEVALGSKLTFDVSGAYNPWTFGSKEKNKKIQHWVVQPEVRFWPYEKWDGHFLGIHGLFASYNAGGINIPVIPLGELKENRFEGYAAGGGFSYGYQWFLGPHWNLELTAGLGYIYYNYERYECHKCGSLLEKTHKHWFGPTHVGLSFIYLFKSKK